ncbi:MAG: T9SS type A sorting domain-containing protein [Bacteroidetes bacterium]|nr:MAG: T9SS type A sorting domain-containing protein [Bacteroidota bacterium]
MKNLIFLSLLILPISLSAQYSCASAVEITDGYSSGTVVTSGTGGYQDWVSSADASCGSASSSAFTSSDVYMYSYTTGSSSGESFYFTIECNYSLDDEHAIGVWTGCSGSSLTSCVVNTYEFKNVLGVCTQNLAANTTYYIGVGKQYGSDYLKYKVIDFTVEKSTTIPANTCSLSNAIDVAEPYSGSTRCNYSAWSGSPSVCGMSIENDSWMKFTAAASDVVIEYSVGGCSRNYGVQLSVFSGSCGSLSVISGSCINYASNNSTGSWNFSGLVPGNTYYIRTDGYAGDLCSYSFSPISGVVILPIELTDFQAVATQNGYNRLSWNTQSENNSDYIELEKSLDGTTFSPIQRISAAGNSSQTNSYLAYDASEDASNTVYYRLKLVDLNGTYFYSPIRAINGSSEKAFKIYPNPTTDGLLNIDLQDPGSFDHLEVRDLQGRLLFQQSTHFSATQKMDLSELPRGMYLLLAVGTFKTLEKRFSIDR